MSEELVAVMVPRGALRLVHRVLADYEEGGNAGIAVQPTPPLDSGPSEEKWTDEEIKRLVDESPYGGLVILEALANRAGEVVGAEELAQALRDRLPAFGGPSKPNADWNTVAGTNGAMSRRIKNRYGRKWPFGSQLDANGHWANSMTVEFAEKVRPHLQRTLEERRKK